MGRITRSARRWVFAILLVLAPACAPTRFAPPTATPLQLRSTIVAADGTPLATLFVQNRTAVQASAIPSVVKAATIAAEDARFLSHAGIDLKGIARAFVANLAAGRVVQGGSTITEQLAKLMYGPNAPRTLGEKLREARLAVWLEQRYSKDEILSMYLNRAYFGHGAYGIQAAVETYFDVPLRALDASRAALLAGLLRAPAALDPFRDPSAALSRRNEVLARMRDAGTITAAEAARASSAPLSLRTRPLPTNAHAPYFVEYVEDQVLSDPAFGATEQERQDALYRGGLTIRTTLDPRLQNAAEQAVSGVLGRAGDPDVALIAIDPHTGAVRAMIGGKDFARAPFNLAVQARRQPGSAFKPFALAAAIEDGISPDKTYQSSETTLHFDAYSSWRVRNYDGTGGGMMSLRTATERSVNAVYARLVMDIGPGTVAGMAQRAGITSPIEPFPSIALGALRTGVSPLEMASAYGTFANDGVHMPPHGIAFAKDASGNVLSDERARRGTPAMDAGIAYEVTSVLQDVARYGTGANAWIGRPMADKTGTTDGHRDAWLVGYTPDLVTAVWVGYRIPRPMTNVHGISVVGASFPSTIWRRFMSRAEAGKKVRDFDVPAALMHVRVGGNGTCIAASDQPGMDESLPVSLVPSSPCPRPTQPAPSPSPSPAVPSPSPSATASPSPKPSASPKPSVSPH
ncbi:MAG: PBP1A family penicillin-binding protein [Actinobacteria bacterium]|nr:MAG: PBP1A family penicillin-binding protein [Actinomycetota bacterium]